MGRSPQHERSVALVLCSITGLVSPQFHVKMDRSFQTVMKVYGDEPPSTKCTEACGVQKEPGKEQDKDSSQKPPQPLHTTDGTSINPSHNPSHNPSREPSVSNSEDLTMAEGEDMAATNEDQEQPPLRQFTRDKTTPDWCVAQEALVGIKDTEDMILDAHVSDPDTMYYHEAMRESERV